MSGRALPSEATRRKILDRIGRLRRREEQGGIEIVPFVRGRRPTDEARHPGLGSSDAAALLLDSEEQNRAYILFTLPAEHEGATVETTLTFTGHDGCLAPVEIPGWQRRRIELQCFDESGNGSLRPARAGDRRFVLALEPERDLLSKGEEDLYGFGHLFLQKVRVELRLLNGDAQVSIAETALDVCDVRPLGSLYGRLLWRLVQPDVERQAAAAGTEDVGEAYHPWFPVLMIGSDKAALYTRALISDIVGKQRYLLDPAWLLRLGLYLELLTCLGIVEAVRDEVGDLLTPEERAAFESERFAPVRERLDPKAWGEVWSLREVAFPRRGVPRAGPVSLLNLLRKKRATLAFLHAHHEDLKQAILLAGPNRIDAQETWQRVFRDAERAVLRQTPVSFPELDRFPRRARDFVLWHEPRHLKLARSSHVPRFMTTILSEQEGLYPSACHQYRASMNSVIAWAKERSFADRAGRECVPPQASLFEAYLHHPEHVDALQRRDGYGETLEVSVPGGAKVDAAELLGGVAIFRMLDPADLLDLARAARPLPLGPLERFIIQDTEGTSLFVVADGEVEVLVRRSEGPDLRVATLGRGEVIGEMSLLTGEPRAATVRAVNGALVYEVGLHQYEPLLRAHPEWIDELAAIMEERLRDRHARLHAYDAPAHRIQIARRVLRHVLGIDDVALPVPAD